MKHLCASSVWKCSRIGGYFDFTLPNITKRKSIIVSCVPKVLWRSPTWNSTSWVCTPKALLTVASTDVVAPTATQAIVDNTREASMRAIQGGQSKIGTWRWYKRTFCHETSSCYNNQKLLMASHLSFVIIVSKKFNGVTISEWFLSKWGLRYE